MVTEKWIVEFGSRLMELRYEFATLHYLEKILYCRKNIKIRTTVELAMSSHPRDTGKVSF